MYGRLRIQGARHETHRCRTSQRAEADPRVDPRVPPPNIPSLSGTVGAGGIYCDAPEDREFRALEVRMELAPLPDAFAVGSSGGLIHQFRSRSDQQAKCIYFNRTPKRTRHKKRVTPVHLCPGPASLIFDKSKRLRKLSAMPQEIRKIGTENRSDPPDPEVDGATVSVMMKFLS